MTRLEALEALAEKVEAGEWDNSAAWKAFGIGVSGRAERVFRGSLDAAKSLHEAVLPGWIARPTIGGTGAGVAFWHCNVENWETGEEISAHNMNCPARAWLLAILKALIAREQNKNE